MMLLSLRNVWVPLVAGVVMASLYIQIYFRSYDHNETFSPSLATTMRKRSVGHQDFSKRITGRIMEGLPYYGIVTDGSATHFKCNLQELLETPMIRKWGGPVGMRQPLPSRMNETGVLLNYSVRLRTSLKILVIGNSLSGQNSDVLEEAFCYPHTDNASAPRFEHGHIDQ